LGCKRIDIRIKDIWQEAVGTGSMKGEVLISPNTNGSII